MIRLGISVEGATEREFVNRILRPHLQHFSVDAIGIDLGGNVSLDKIRHVLPALLGGFDRVSTLYDFYGFKGRGDHTTEALEQAIGELVNPDHQHRFLPYVQRYEFEALLFAVPEHVVTHLQGDSGQLQIMQAAVKRSNSPEWVNGRLETSPSHHLQHLFPGYDKKLHGPAIINLAGLEAVRKECPRFHAWILQLENLASS